LYAYLQARADQKAQAGDSEDAEVEEGEVEDELEEGEEVGLVLANTQEWRGGLPKVRTQYATLCNEMDAKRKISVDEMSLVGTRICAFCKRQRARGYNVDEHYGEGSDDPLWPLGPGRPHTDEAIARALLRTHFTCAPTLRSCTHLHTPIHAYPKQEDDSDKDEEHKEKDTVEGIVEELPATPAPDPQQDGPAKVYVHILSHTHSHTDLQPRSQQYAHAHMQLGV
jgi:hypothetical protein